MKAIYNIPYGVYVLTARAEKNNGCIINTLMQVTSSPCKISITVNKENYTTSMIEKTGVFNVSILDMSTSFDIITRFGFSSGRNTDKFEGFTDFKIAGNGVPYITKHTNSYISAKVVSKIDVGTHYTFIADVTEDVVLSTKESVTYSYYLNKIKPKPAALKKRVYVCRICGYVYEGEELPKDFICPICKHGAEDFELKEETISNLKNEEIIGSKNESKENIYYCQVCGNLEKSEINVEKCAICGAQMIKVTV